MKIKTLLLLLDQTYRLDQLKRAGPYGTIEIRFLSIIIFYTGMKYIPVRVLLGEMYGYFSIMVP